MRQGARLLAALLPLAVPAWAAALDIKVLPEESSAGRTAVRITADLKDAGGSCKQSSLALVGPALSKPLPIEMKNCAIKGENLAATVFIPRVQKRAEKLEAVLQACDAEEDPTKRKCQEYRYSLSELAGLLQPWPLILQKVETARGELVFQSRGLPPGFSDARAVRVVDWDPAPYKPAGRPPEVSAKESGLILTIPLNCSSLELSRTELTQAVFEVQDAEGDSLPLSFEGALPLCGQPPLRDMLKRLGFVGGGACLALLGLLGGIQVGRWNCSKRDEPTQAELPGWLKDSVQGLSEKLDDGFTELKTHIDCLKPSLVSTGLPGVALEDEPDGLESQPFATGGEPTWQEREFLQTVNDWWARGDGDKEALISGLIQSGAKLYVSFDIDATQQGIVGKTLSFRPSDGPAGWAWYPLSKGETLAVPADPYVFQAGNMIEVLRFLFDGIGESPKNFRFYRVHKACRLRVNSPGSDRYTLAEKGFLELADRSGAKLPGPSPATGKTYAPASPRRGAPKSQPVTAPGPSLREIEDLLRMVFRSEAGNLQPVQISQPVDTSCEAIDALRSRIDQVSGELRKLDDIQKLVADLGQKLESLKQVAKAAVPVAAPAPPVRRFEPQAPPPAPSYPPPSPPVKAEPAESVIPQSVVVAPPRAVAAESAPGEFLRRAGQALPALVTAASELLGSPSPSDYLRRLFTLWKELHQTQTDPSWKTNLVHLQVARISERERIFTAHPVKVYENFREAKCRCGDLPEAYLLQIFLAVRNESDLMAIAMVSSNLAERFSEGYSLLTGDEDPRDKGSLTMKRPAVLQSVNGSSESWRVILPMEVAPL